MSHNRSYIHYRQNYYMTFGKRSQASYSMWPSWKLIKTVFLPSKSTSLGVRKVQKTLRITWQEADFQAPISIQLPPLTGKVQTATDISSQPSLRCRFQCYLHYNEHYFVWHARTLYFNKKKKSLSELKCTLNCKSTLFLQRAVKKIQQHDIFAQFTFTVTGLIFNLLESGKFFLYAKA